jgi:hypothetical protein
MNSVLLTLRAPVVDLRPFSRPDYPQGIRLPPSWSEDQEFVRNFGIIAKRPQGPIDPWPAERAFCSFGRVLRFPASYPALLNRQVPDFDFFGIKRRLYPATTRNDLFYFDLQLAGRSRHFSRKPGKSPRLYEPARIDLEGTIRAVLNISTIVHIAGGVTTEQPVGKFGPPITRALDSATTVGGASGNMFPGTLAVAIELEDWDGISSSWGVEWIVGGLKLYAKTITFQGAAVSVFVITRPRHIDRYQARALRIHLLRLHAERQYLRRMARLLATERFIAGCDHSQLERVQNALNHCLGTLTRVASHGFSTPEVATAFMADRTLSGSDLEIMMDRVKEFRPLIGRRLRQLQDLDDMIDERWRRIVDDNPAARNFIYVKEAHMASYDQRGSQIGAAGDNASASNFTFGGQLNVGTMTEAEAQSLQVAFQTLRKHLADKLVSGSAIDIESEQISSTRIGAAIGALSEAEGAIAARDENRTNSALQRSGRWLASFAQGIGVEIAAAAIRSALHLQ